MDLTAVKERLREAVERRADVLVAASHQIHEHPELNYEEHFAHDLLTGLLADEGLEVERHAYGLDTAFVARAGHLAGPRSPCCASTTPSRASATPAGTTSSPPPAWGPAWPRPRWPRSWAAGWSCIGTPAEEGGGGKILLARRGAFEGVDAAMMVHPAGYDLSRMDVIAVQELTATYTGRAAHAAAFPHKGRNALDAAVLGYLNVAALRQHIRPTERVHGIFTEGGDKPNIVPALAETHWMVRSPQHPHPGPAQGPGGGLPGGRRRRRRAARWSWRWKPVVYADMLDNEVMVDLYARQQRGPGPAARSTRTRSWPWWAAPTWATSATWSRRSTR